MAPRCLGLLVLFFRIVQLKRRNSKIKMDKFSIKNSSASNKFNILYIYIYKTSSSSFPNLPLHIPAQLCQAKFTQSSSHLANSIPSKFTCLPWENPFPPLFSPPPKRIFPRGDVQRFESPEAEEGRKGQGRGRLPPVKGPAWLNTEQETWV